MKAIVVTDQAAGTAGVKLVRGAGGWQVADVQRVRGGPEDVVGLILRTAQQDGRGLGWGAHRGDPSAGRVGVWSRGH